MARPVVNYYLLLALKTFNKETDLPRKLGRGKNRTKANAVESTLILRSTNSETERLTCHRPSGEIS